MSPSFDLPSVDRLTTGTIGPPGERVFYIQARRGAQLVTLRLEKVQVAALAQYLAQRLTDLPPAGEVPSDPDALALEQPVDPEWTVGAIGVSYDEDADRIVIVTEELVDTGEEEEEEEATDIPLGERPDRSVARFALTREQAAAFVVRAAAVVARGRPPCQLCGRPLDPAGEHICIKTNGHSPR